MSSADKRLLISTEITSVCCNDLLLSELKKLNNRIELVGETQLRNSLTETPLYKLHDRLIIVVKDTPNLEYYRIIDRFDYAKVIKNFKLLNDLYRNEIFLLSLKFEDSTMNIYAGGPQWKKIVRNFGLEYKTNLLNNFQPVENYLTVK